MKKGLHRLWIVLSVLWLITVISTAITNFPNKPKAYHLEIVGGLDFEGIERLGKMEWRKIPIPEAEYREMLARYQKERAEHIGGHIAFWLVPVLGLYALGWAITWVIHGFKPKKEGG